MPWPFSTKSEPPAETKGELTDPTSASWETLLGDFTQSASGVAVSAASAMRVPAVNAAVNLIAGTVGLLPCKLFEREGEGKKPATDNEAYMLVHDDANDWQSAGKVRELITTDAILHGDGYGLANKVAGKPAEILYLPRSKVGLEHKDDGTPRYKVGERYYSPSEIIHLQAPSLDGKTGLGLISAGRDAIGLAILLERTSARLFKNNSRPGGVLSFKGKLNLDAIRRIGESWRNAHGGDKAGGVAVLDHDGSYEPIAFTSVESQHAEQRNFSIAEVARLTRVPVTMLQELSKGTFANTEQQAMQFLQLCLLPWLKAWTDAYRRTLLTEEERRTHLFEFVVDDLLRADTATRAEAWSKFRAAGVLTANEVRAAENRPAHPDGNVLANPYTTAGAANDNTPTQENVDERNRA